MCKEEGGQLARSEIYSDPSAAMVFMLERGMLKPEQLMGQGYFHTRTV